MTIKNPTLVSTIATLTAPKHISVSGNYAYVCAYGTPYVQVYDITNKAAPKLKSNINVVINPFWTQAVNNILFICDGNGLDIFDVSNKSLPAFLSSTPIASTAESISVIGNYAYIVTHNPANLMIYDISNPSIPTLKSSIVGGANGQPYSIFVSGNYAYVSGYDATLGIFDISNPAAPILKSTTATGNQAYEVFVSGNYAYIAAFASSEFQIFDVTNPAAPVLKSSVVLPGYVPSISVQLNYAYVLDYSDNTLNMYDISNPAQPVYLGGVNATGSQTRFIAVQGDYSYVVGYQSNTLKIYSTAIPASQNPNNIALAQSANHFSLNNFHRPVSLLGTYKS